MRIVCSAVHPTGHLVMARLPDGAVFTATFVDEPAPRDITDMVADLLLTGALDAAEQSQTGRPDPDEQVTAARVSYQQPLLPGQTVPAASFTWAHLPTRQGGDFDPAEVLALLARGIAVNLTAGIAHEAADVPDTPAGAEDPGEGTGAPA